MATNIRPMPPPLKEKVVDEDGYVSRAWAMFFTNIYRYQQAMAAMDGTYTLGTGSTDGEITIEGGVISDIQEVVA